MRLINVFTVNITSRFTSEQGHGTIKRLQGEGENTHFPSPDPCQCLIFMYLLTPAQTYMEAGEPAGEPAVSLLQSLRAMCVTWPHVSWTSGCIPMHLCTGQMELVLRLLSSQLQSIFQKRSWEGWDRSGPGWVLDISFQYHGWDLFWEGHGDGYSHQVGCSLPENTRRDLDWVCLTLTDCINSVWARKQSIRQTLLCNCRWTHIWGRQASGWQKPLWQLLIGLSKE